MSRELPEQQPPPVQRIRLRYAKRGRMRFSSHRDFSRAFERAVSRAGIPIAFSSGFHPHPRISYTGAAPTGAASEAEYLEIALAKQVDPAEIARSLDAALPAGLDIIEAVEAVPGSLADRLTGSRWEIRLPNATVDAASAAVEALLCSAEVVVERMTKKGMRSFDVRGAVVALRAEADTRGGAQLDVVLRHGVPAVRTDDLLTGLAAASGLDIGGALHTRVAQGVLDEGGEIADPLAP